MEIVIKNLQKKVPLNPPQIIKTVKTILRREGISKASVSIVFVTSQKIRVFNRKYLGRDYGTDVLAFDFADSSSTVPACPPQPRPLARTGRRARRHAITISGDVIISTDAAIKNSRYYKTSLDREIMLYIIHGILHLCGFNDHKDKDIKRMRKKEQELLEYLTGMIKKII